MPRIPRSRPYPSVPVRVLREDDGFGLIEVLVSAVLVVVCGMATLSLLDKSTQASVSNRQRAVAANLAHNALNTMRAQTFSTLSNYSSSGPVAAGGTKYTVVSQATWTTDANTPLNCASTGNASPYLRITSTVTWPSMGSIKPVTASSLVSPRASDVAEGAGSLVVTVRNADSLGVPDVNVTVAGQSAVTNAQGCVIFHFVPAGKQTVTWSKTGYVTPDGKPATQDVSITNGTISTITPSYDLPGKITANVIAETVNGSLNMSTTAGAFNAEARTNNTYLPFAAIDTTPAWASLASSLTNSGVYPTKAGYTLYAGDCAGSDPKNFVSDFETTHPNAQAVTTAGGSVTKTAYVHRMTVTVKQNGSGATSARLVITPSGMSSDCKSEYVTDVKTISSSTNGVWTVDLPYGYWDVCADNNTSGTSRRMQDFGVVNSIPANGATPLSGVPSDTTTAKTINFTSTKQGPCT